MLIIRISPSKIYFDYYDLKNLKSFLFFNHQKILSLKILCIVTKLEMLNK